MTAIEVKEMLNRVGTITRYERVHAGAYCNSELSLLCLELAKQFVDDDIEGVVGTAGDSGVAISRWVAYHLSKLKLVNERTLPFHPERAIDGSFVFSLGGARMCLPGRRALIVGENLNADFKRLVEATRAIGANVIGLGTFRNMGGFQPEDMGNPPKMFCLVND